MNERRRRIADALYAAGRAHDEGHTDRLARWRNLEPESAQLLAILVRVASARRVLEIGTSNGHSTLWLADAVEATGGALVSVEIDAARSELARSQLREAGLEAHVELRVEDGAATLAGAPDDAWDFIFLDAERPAYTGYLPDLVRALAPGGTLAIDNVRSHEHELAEFTRQIEARAELAQTVVAIGAGLRIAVRSPTQ